VLDAVGLDAEHTAVYRHLLASPSASVQDVVRALGLPPGRAADVVVALERLGLVARHAGSSNRLVASPPSVALRPMLLEQERRLSQAQGTLLELDRLYRDGAARRAPADVVDVVLGADAVRQRFVQLQASARTRVDAWVLTAVAVMSSTENSEHEERALHRGVRYRVLVERAVLERPGFVAAAREGTALGEEVRVLPRLPSRLIVVDETLALLPMRPDGSGTEQGALLLHPSPLLDLVVAAFELHWSAAAVLRLGDDPAQPAPEGGSGPSPTPTDRAMLELLLLGLTDSATGTQLGMSLRTVQRRIAELMATVGASTRLQLGAEAVRRGWV
jgi:sugar-specific transcriptional regulator TrmB